MQKTILDGRPRRMTVEGIEWVYVGFACGCYSISPANLKEADEYHPRFNYCPAHHMRAMRHQYQHKERC